MYYRKPYYYSDFRCVADKCPDTCCSGWGIVIDEKSMRKYEKLPFDDREYVMSKVDIEEQMYKRCKNRCAFLNEENLCDLYIRLGGNAFCNTCRRYPRHFEEYGNLIEAALSMSCPVAARMIVLNKEKDRFIAYSNKKNSPHKDEVDYVLLSCILGARSHILNITSDRNINYDMRMKRVYQYSHKVQKIIYNYERLGNRVKKKECVAELMLKMDMLTQKELLYGENKKEKCSGEISCNQNRQTCMKDVIDIVDMLENINPEWPEMMHEMKKILYEDMSNEQYISYSNEFAEYMKDRMYEYEHIFNYFIYTYYMGGVYDYNVHAMTKFAVISTEIIKDLGLLCFIKSGRKFSEDEQVKICYTYSRQIEHSDDNLSMLEGLLVAHPKFSDKKLINIIN